MCSRLYSFHGEEVTPENSTYVIAYEVQTIGETEYKVILAYEMFSTYDEDAIEAYIESQKSTHPNRQCRVVGFDPFTSPVPLEKLDHYDLAHPSPTIVSSGEKALAYVEIFEYVP